MVKVLRAAADSPTTVADTVLDFSCSILPFIRQPFDEDSVFFDNLLNKILPVLTLFFFFAEQKWETIISTGRRYYQVGEIITVCVCVSVSSPLAWASTRVLITASFALQFISIFSAMFCRHYFICDSWKMRHVCFSNGFKWSSFHIIAHFTIRCFRVYMLQLGHKYQYMSFNNN